MPPLLSQSTSELMPTARQYPRRTRVGGYVISTAAATAWASRLCGQKLHPFYDRPSVWMIIRDRVRPHGLDFSDLSDIPDSSILVIITQSARFNGYQDMDPKLIPQFEKGEREAVARKLLEEEGIEIVGFKTLLRGE